jgi:hypothetical protein
MLYVEYSSCELLRHLAQDTGFSKYSIVKAMKMPKLQIYKINFTTHSEGTSICSNDILKDTESQKERQRERGERERACA